MQFRQLGLTGISASVIALGCADLAGPSKYEEELDVQELIRTALDQGINYFDTAEAYAEGESERVLGQALKTIPRESIVISSKISHTNCGKNNLIAACEASLKRLQTDYIDLYQVHWHEAGIPLEDTMEALDGLQTQGKIRAAGVCNFGARDIQGISDIGTVANNQLPYSLLFRAVEYDILPACQVRDVTITCYCPLMMGLLAGAYGHADEVPDGIARTRHFAHTRPMARHHGEAGCEAETFDAIGRLSSLAEEAGLPLPTLSLAWLLHQPNISAVMTGARNSGQLAENTKAAQIRLTADILENIENITIPLKNLLGPNADMWRSESRLV